MHNVFFTFESPLAGFFHEEVLARELGPHRKEAIEELDRPVVTVRTLVGPVTSPGSSSSDGGTPRGSSAGGAPVKAAGTGPDSLVDDLSLASKR